MRSFSLGNYFFLSISLILIISFFIIKDYYALVIGIGVLPVGLKGLFPYKQYDTLQTYCTILSLTIYIYYKFIH